MENANPVIHSTTTELVLSADNYNDNIIDEIDKSEIFELIRNINDPEHPLTLEQLNVVQRDHVWIGDSCNSNQVLPLSSVSSQGYRLVKVEFTPTIPHCSMATLIGLSIRVKLQRCLPSDYKIDVCIREGTHQSEEAINKQLNDKERVSAAVENSHLLSVVNQCLKAH